MKKMFAVVVLASASLAACGGGKKADTTPAHASPETGKTGGAAYGDKAGATTPPTPSASANPCAGK